MLDRSESRFAALKHRIDPDFLSEDLIYLVVCNLNMDATPGLPLCKHYKTNRDLFGFDGLSVNPDRFKIFINFFFIWLETLVQYPFRVFIKEEPHKQSKIIEGRWRLIFSAPLYYQILEHLLIGKMDKLEEENQWNLPTKLAWHPFWGGAAMSRSTFDNPCSMDKKCWDWTMPDYLCRLDYDFRLRMVVSAPDQWYSLMEWFYNSVFKEAKFQLSSGLLFQQRFEGMMKSGLVRTLSTNSHCQWFIHLLSTLVCGHSHVMWCIGDDVLTSHPCSEYLLETSKHCILKETVWANHFAGFDLEKVIPLYWSKHVARLLYATDTLPDILDNYQRLYVYDEVKLKLIQELLAWADITKVRSVAYLRRWAVQRPSNFKFFFEC